MRGVKVVARVAVLAAALPLSGCATLFGGYDVAANGLPREEEALRRSLAFEPRKAYTEVIEGKGALPADDLLRLLYAGTAGYYAGRWHESSRLLDLASYVAEDRVTVSVSRQALSMITSDRTLAYTPGRTERLMIPYLAAMTYLRAGDLEGAAVEARRIEALLDQLDEGTPRDSIPDESRFLHYFAGAVFEAAGDWNAADVAYRRSGSLAESLGGGVEGDGGAAAGPASDSLGDVIVLVERGFVPHRVEQSVVVAIPGSQMALLTDGSAADRAAAAAAAATRILLVAAALYGDRSGFYHDRGYRSSIHLAPWEDEPCSKRRRACGDDDDEEAEGAPYLLRISWPVLVQEAAPPAPLRVRAGTLGVDATARLDLAAGTRRDFEAERPAVLARTVARAAAKVALSSSVEESIAKKDATAGEILGILANLGTLLTERADTRGWHLLPGSVSLVRLRLPAGRHTLTIETDRSGGGSGGGAGGRVEQLGAVDVRPGATTFTTMRIWR